MKFYIKKLFDHYREPLTDAEKVQLLLKIPQPIQRSKEWFDMRHSMMTASDIAAIIGANKYSSRKEILLSKCGVTKKFQGNIATRWGQKFEPVATKIYETLTNSEVIEFGLIPHPVISWLGASPDGITHAGRMLEIKCPYYNRSIDTVPEYYYPQMQLQLECCDLEYCDFFQCKFKEISKEEFESNISSQFKGVIISINDYDPQRETNPDTTYEYDPPEVDARIKELNKRYSGTCIKVTKIYWILEKSTLIEIKRDREWFRTHLPELRQFWEEVIYYREHPEELKAALQETLKGTEKEISIDIGYTPPAVAVSRCISETSLFVSDSDSENEF